MSEQKHKQYLMLILFAYLVAITTLAIGGELPNTPIRFAEFIGVGLGIAIFPLLAMRFLGIPAGWIIFLLMTMGYTQGQLSWLYQDDDHKRATAKSYEYHPKQCEFSVKFPSKPAVKVYSHPKIGDYKVAQWLSSEPDNSSFLRAECLRLPNMTKQIKSVGAKQFMLNRLEAYAENNGLSSVEYHYKLDDLGHVGTARGYKKIQGTPTTYEILSIAGTNSFISLIAGGNSATYPQREISPFLDSVKRIRIRDSQ